MDTLTLMTLIAAYIAVYLVILGAAVSNYFEEFPQERKRIREGIFFEIEKSIFASTLLFFPSKTRKSRCFSTRLQFNLARALLAFLPFFSAFMIFM